MIYDTCFPIKKLQKNFDIPGWWNQLGSGEEFQNAESYIWKKNLYNLAVTSGTAIIVHFQM